MAVSGTEPTLLKMGSKGSISGGRDADIVEQMWLIGDQLTNEGIRFE